METVLAVAVIGYLAYVFYSNYQDALHRGLAKDLAELEQFRKKRDIEQAASLMAKKMRDEFARELEASRFQAAVQAAVQAQNQQGGQKTAAPRYQPTQPAQPQAEQFTWRQQREQASSVVPHSEEPPMSTPEMETAHGDQPVVYNRDQDFPEYSQL